MLLFIRSVTLHMPGSNVPIRQPHNRATESNCGLFVKLLNVDVIETIHRFDSINEIVC